VTIYQAHLSSKSPMARKSEPCPVSIRLSSDTCAIKQLTRNGTGVDYYVLRPQRYRCNNQGLSEDQLKVGTIVKIGERNKVKLLRSKRNSEKCDDFVTSLKVSGNTFNTLSSLETTRFAFRVFGNTAWRINSTRFGIDLGRRTTDK